VLRVTGHMSVAQHDSCIPGTFMGKGEREKWG
jgi:hypothetical protein